MDAISFVLGIKSSHLRSSHLKDLVYRGRVLKTSKIKDDGSAVNNSATTNGHEDVLHKSKGDPKTAWVMAVYEDDAGDEQRWKRSINSSGSSEYRINDRVVTAQQYNDSLEKENILIKARNFLVFQGDVETIAAQSPQDLTRLIEQISGSLEYKAEYERLQTEVERAAENQADKLHRRRGINSEIKQFQEQKKEAENYQKKMDERDTSIAIQKLWRLYHLQKQMDLATAEIQEHQENLKEFRRNLNTAQETLDDARKEQAACGREVGKIERDLKTRQKLAEDQESQLIPIEEKVKESTSQLNATRQRVERLTQEYEKSDIEIKKLRKDISKVEKARALFEEEWKGMIKQQGKALEEDDHREYRNIRQSVATKTSFNQNSLDILERQLKNDEITVNGLSGKVITIRSVEDKLVQELADIEERRDTLRLSIEARVAEIDELKTKHNHLRSKKTQTEQRRREIEEQLTVALNKLQESNDSNQRNNREREMKERVINLRRMFPGVKGQVRGSCKPTSKKYEEAVITAMGHNFDSVIVDSVKTANECIQYLKEQRMPRMTFIPLDTIKAHTPNAAVAAVDGARSTIQVVEYEPALERAIQFACGTSVVCDRFEIAKEIVHVKRIPVKAVDLDGNVVHKSGIMTGGKTGKSRKTFVQHDTENLKKAVEKLQEELTRLPRADPRGEEESELKISLDGLQQRVKFTKSELAAYDKNVLSKKKQLDNERKQLAEMEPRLADEQLKLDKSKQTVAKFQTAIAKVEDQMFADFCKRLGYVDIRAYEAQQGSMAEQAAEKRAEFDVQKERLTSSLSWAEKRREDLKMREQQLEINAKRLENDLQAYQYDKIKINRAISKERAALEALEEELAIIQEKHTKKVDAVGAARAQVQERTREIEHRMKSVAALETEVRKTSGTLFDQLRRCKMDQIQLPLLQGSLDHLPNKDNLLQVDSNTMDIDGEDLLEDLQANSLEDYGIEIDFDSLDDDLKNVSFIFFRLQSSFCF